MKKIILKSISIIFTFVSILSISNFAKADTYSFNYTEGTINNGNGTYSPNTVSVITNINFYPTYDSIHNTISAIQFVNYCLLSTNSGGCVSGAGNYNGFMSMSVFMSGLKLIGNDGSILGLSTYPHTQDIGYGGSLTWSQIPIPSSAVSDPDFYHLTSIIGNIVLQTGQSPIQYHYLFGGDISTNGPQFTVINSSTSSTTTLPKIFSR